jgi:hypothetical protein
MTAGMLHSRKKIAVVKPIAFDLVNRVAIFLSPFFRRIRSTWFYPVAIAPSTDPLFRP